MQGVEKTEELKADIVKHVRNVAGPTVKPEIIMFTDALPKTRSGKIMRRVLKAIATMGDIGDVMTLTNPEVVQALVDERAKMGEIKF
jgi:acetyl-CoA synthetase